MALQIRVESEGKVVEHQGVLTVVPAGQVENIGWQSTSAFGIFC